MPIPFIQDKLKKDILPSLLVDQSLDVVYLHAKEKEITRQVTSHKNGNGLLTLRKPIVKIVRDSVQRLIVDGNGISQELAACFTPKLTEHHYTEKISKEINALIGQGKIKKKDLNNLIKKIVPDTTCTNPKKLQELKNKLNSGLYSVKDLGRGVNWIIVDKTALGSLITLTGLSETEQDSIAKGIQELLAGHGPTEVWEFLDKHIELAITQIFANLASHTPGTDDILVATVKRLKKIADTHIVAGKKPDFNKITDEILSLADVDLYHPIPGLPKALQGLIHYLAKAEIANRLKNIYEKPGLVTSYRLQAITTTAERQVQRIKKGSSEDQVCLSAFCNDLSAFGSDALFDDLFSTQKEARSLIEGIFPEAGAKELGESFIEAWNAVTAVPTEKEKLVSGIKGGTKDLFNAVTLEAVGNMFKQIQTEDEANNMDKTTELFNRIPNIIKEVPPAIPVMIGPKTKEEAEIEEKQDLGFYTELTKEIVKIVLPVGADSKFMQAIPSEYRGLVWDAVENKGLPKLFQVIVNQMLKPESLKGMCVGIFKKVNALLSAPGKFEAKKETAPQKEANQELNKACGKAFVAIVNRMLPGLIDSYLVKKYFTQDIIDATIGSVVRGFISDTMWMDILQPALQSAVDNKVFVNKPRDTSIPEISIDEQLTAEMKKGISLLPNYIMAQLQNILDGIVADYKGKDKVGFANALNIAGKYVGFLIIKRVFQVIFALTMPTIRRKISNWLVTGGTNAVELFNTQKNEERSSTNSGGHSSRTKPHLNSSRPISKGKNNALQKYRHKELNTGQFNAKAQRNAKRVCGETNSLFPHKPSLRFFAPLRLCVKKIMVVNLNETEDSSVSCTIDLNHPFP